MRTSIVLSAMLLAWIAVAEMAPGQVPYQPPFLPPPPPPMAPLMYLRFSGPKETKITIYRGVDAGQTLELPVTVGFRPGYGYRFAVHDVPGFGAQAFYPSIEVRGSLALMPKLRNAEFPANIVFHEEEFRKVLAGTFIKKVVVLERPDEALPVATKADEPIEIPVPGSRDPLVDGNERGMPLVGFYMGQRFMTPQEMNALATPSTVLLPGERFLGTPRQPPYLQWRLCPVFDPIYGPKHAGDWMTLYDGGDTRGPAGFGRDGTLKGFDPTDTVAQYRDSKGNPKMAVSNRVALCIPRYLIFKSETNLANQITRINPAATQAIKMPDNMAGQAGLASDWQLRQVDAVATKLGLSAAHNTMATAITGKSLGLDVKSSLRSPAAVDGSIAGPVRSDARDGPLLIIKWPDKTGALIGDIVTFYLKYTNSGEQPITEIVVADSLGARFEYVKGSTKTDREANFTMQTNEVGSAVLRWEVSGTLQPRESGVISFQVRIR